MRYVTAGLATGVLIQACAAPAIAGEPPLTRAAQPSCASCGAFGRTVIEDTRDVFTAPARWRKPEWRSATRKALIVAGAMALLDRPVRDHVQARRNGTADRVANTFEPFGGEYAAGILVGYFLAGRFADNPSARRIAVDGAVSGVITSMLLVPTLKAITGRSRPRADQGAFDFHPFGKGASFPSGHTAAAFTVAASIAENNDARWVKALSYGVASLVGYARVEQDAHFLSDVTASAMIGIGVAKHVAGRNRKRRGIEITALRDADVWGIELTKAF